MLERLLDDAHPSEVRRGIVPITAARTAANALYRFTPVLLATIADGLDVSIGELSIAITIAELCGLTAPLLGRLVDRLDRRTAMASGLSGVVAGALGIAVTGNVVGFAIGLLVLSISKLVFDISQGAWIADHVPFARRGQVVGFTETSWALGLLVGVSGLALITAALSWAWAYAVGGVAVGVATAVLWRRVVPDHNPAKPAPRPAGNGPFRMTGAGWMAVLGTAALVVASQLVFVTFGAWLEDDRGLATAALGAVTFGLGAVELSASMLSTTRTDRWGKERSVIGGAGLMVVATIAFVAFNSWLPAAIASLGLFLGGFEFAIVSSLPIATTLVPGRPAAGLGRYFVAMSIARSLTTIPAALLLDHAGFSWCITAAAVMAVGAAAFMAARQRFLLRLTTVSGSAGA